MIELNYEFKAKVIPALAFSCSFELCRKQWNGGNIIDL